MPSTTLTSVIAQSSPPMILAVINAISDTGTLRGRIQAFSFAGASTPVTRRTSRPKGLFHAPGQAIPIVASGFSKANLNAYPISILLQVPVTIANVHNVSPEMALANEMIGAVDGELDGLEDAFFNGNSATNINQFDGLKTILNLLSNPQVVNAGGTAINGCTSAYVVALATENQAMNEANGAQGIAFGVGGNGRIEVSEAWGRQHIAGLVAGEFLDSYTNSISGQVGLHIGASFAIARIANISPANPLTPALLDAALALVKVRNAEVLIITSRKGRNSYKQALRSAGGWVEPQGPVSLTHDGVEMLTSDYILDNEAVVA